MKLAEAQMKKGDGFIAYFSQLLLFLKNARLIKWHNAVVKLLMTHFPIQEGVYVVHHIVL